MSLKKIFLSFVVPAAIFLNCTQAQAGVMSTFPNLYLKSDDKVQIETFKKNNTTTTLYYRYQAVAKAMETGDREACKKILAGYIQADTEYWKAQVAKPLNLPDKPKVSGKDKKEAMERYKERVELLEKADAKRKAVATTYLNWVSVEIPNWVRSVDGKPPLPDKPAIQEEGPDKKAKGKTKKETGDDE